MISFDDTDVLMTKAISHFTQEISSIRTGRATSALVEEIVCPAYGGQQLLTIKELASITIADPQTLIITPWDNSIIGDIRKGILEANVGLNPILETVLIRIPVPPLTGERREEYVKLVRAKLEEARVAIRNIRQDKIKMIRNQFEAKQLSEDEKFRYEKELQNLTDKYIDEAGRLAEQKENQILAI